jgi:pilus assembly protein CpaE
MEAMGGVPIIMFTAKDQPADKIAGFEVGVDDFLIKPTTPKELLQRVATLLERSRPGSAPLSRGVEPDVDGGPTSDAPGAMLERSMHSPLAQMAGPGELPTGSGGLGMVVAVMGARGGVGATTLAINLAVAMGEQGRQTTLADLDMQQGHIALYLQRPTRQGLHNLAGHERMALIRQVPQELIPAGEHLHLLLTQANLDGRYPILKPSQVGNLLGTLRRYNDCVVIDVGRGLSAISQLVLGQADQLLLCSRPERVSLTAARQLLQHIRELPYAGEVKIVLIDFEEYRSLPRAAIENYLGQPVLATVRVEVSRLAQAVNAGQPLFHMSEPGTPFASAIAELSRELHPLS